MMTPGDYRAQLQALLPGGPAWTREPDAVLTAMMDAMAQELARLDLRAHQLLEETDPRTAYALLDQWESVLGLPDPCTQSATGLTARRQACWRKLAYQSGQTPAFYVSLAGAIGFDVEIHEFDPQVDDYDATLADEVAAGLWRYIWRVHVLNAGVFNYFVAGDTAGMSLLEGEPALDIECIIRAAAPAHTHVIFSYPTQDNAGAAERLLEGGGRLRLESGAKQLLEEQ